MSPEEKEERAAKKRAEHERLMTVEKAQLALTDEERLIMQMRIKKNREDERLIDEYRRSFRSLNRAIYDIRNANGYTPAITGDQDPESTPELTVDILIEAMTTISESLRRGIHLMESHPERARKIMADNVTLLEFTATRIRGIPVPDGPVVISAPPQVTQ